MARTAKEIQDLALSLVEKAINPPMVLDDHANAVSTGVAQALDKYVADMATFGTAMIDASAFSQRVIDLAAQHPSRLRAICTDLKPRGVAPVVTPPATVPEGEFQEPTPEASESAGWYMGEAKRVLTPVFRVSFPKVFKAEAFQEGQEPKYSIVMLFSKQMGTEDVAKFEAMKRMAAETAKAKWGDKMPKNLRSPFRDGSEKDLPGYEDVVFVSASSKQKPGLVNEDAEPILNPEDFYPGCYAHAYLTCYAYDTAGNRGVAFGLSTVQKIKDGEPFAPRNNAQDDFAPVPGATVAQAPADIDNIFGQ
jgi:hypothetical protein